MEKKTARLSVGDFATQNYTPIDGLIAAEGNRFPPSFTFNQPNILDGVAFILCVNGTALLKINSVVYPVDTDTILTILPSHIVEPLEKSEDLKIRMLVFSLEMVSELHMHLDSVKAIGTGPCIRVSAADKDVLSRMYDLVTLLQNQAGYTQRHDIVKNMLHTLLLEIGAIYGNAAPRRRVQAATRAEELTEQFLKALADNFRSERAPAFYADKLCVTAKYLSQIVKEATGETVFEWINKVVMLGARNMLRTSDLSVLQVSEELNFPNPSFFGRYFKKHAGITPLEYKKQAFE